MNVNKVITKEYEQKTLGEHGKNEPKTNPNKAKFKKAIMNVKSFHAVDYENISNWAICENKPNTNPIKPNFKGKIGREWPPMKSSKSNEKIFVATIFFVLRHPLTICHPILSRQR